MSFIEPKQKNKTFGMKEKKESTMKDLMFNDV